MGLGLQGTFTACHFSNSFFSFCFKVDISIFVSIFIIRCDPSVFSKNKKVMTKMRFRQKIIACKRDRTRAYKVGVNSACAAPFKLLFIVILFEIHRNAILKVVSKNSGHIRFWILRSKLIELC